MKENLLVFYGGRSSEHDISILTAIQVLKNIDKEKYEIIPVYVTKTSELILVDDYLNVDCYSNKDNIKGSILEVSFKEKTLLKKTRFSYKSCGKISCAINCMHGLNGEDGSIAGFLQLLNIPQTSPGVLSSAICMDKVIMKDIFKVHDFPIVKHLFFTRDEYFANPLKILGDIEENFTYPVILKPSNLGSSIGINKATNKEELMESIEIASEFDGRIIVEEVVENLREINCSVIGTTSICEASVLEEPKNWKDFLTFDEKYMTNLKNNNKRIIDVKLPEELEKQIKDISIKAFKTFCCSGVVRIDYLLNSKTNELFINEINTVPGSFAFYLWQNKYSFKVLINKLIEFAILENEEKNKNRFSYASDVLENFKKNNSQIQK